MSTLLMAGLEALTKPAPVTGTLLGTVRQNGKIYFSKPKPSLEELTVCPDCQNSVVDRQGELRCLNSQCGWRNPSLEPSGEGISDGYVVVWNGSVNKITAVNPCANRKDYEVMLIRPLPFVSKKIKTKREHAFLKACSERKLLYRVWEKVLPVFVEVDYQELPAGKDSIRHRGERERQRCPRCWSSFFKQKQNRLICFDCHLEYFHGFENKETAAEQKRDRDGSPHTVSLMPKHNQQRKLTPQEFVSGMLWLGRIKKLVRRKERIKSALSFEILVEGKLVRDVIETAPKWLKERAVMEQANDIWERFQRDKDSKPLVTKNDIEAQVGAEGLLLLKSVLEKKT